MDNVPAAEEAARGGVERVEYCSRLDQDGLTPDLGQLRLVVQRLDVPIFAMVRPRAGDFTASSAELDQMLQSIEAVRGAGAQGIVLGVLQSDGSIDRVQLQRLVQAADGLPVTFHRAFDSIPNPQESLETLIECGVTRLLTSGDGASAWEGRELLRELVVQAGSRLVMMPGGGVRSEHVRELLDFTGAQEIHSSRLLDL